MSEVQYYNFPVCLLKGFIGNPKSVLDSILDFAVYEHSDKLGIGTEVDRFKASSDYFGIKFGSEKGSFKNGKELFDSIDTRTARAGISKAVFWDYYKNAGRKSDFEKVCLLGHLAFKSILGNKPSAKTNNELWFSRMSGFSEKVEAREWELALERYYNHYQTRKIKMELVRNWGLVTYSRYHKGFYISYSLTLEKLIEEAENRRKSNWEQEYKAKEKEAVKAVLNRLRKPP